MQKSTVSAFSFWSRTLFDRLLRRLISKLQNFDRSRRRFLEDQYALDIHGILPNTVRNVPDRRSHGDKDNHPHGFDERPCLNLRRHHGKQEKSEYAP